MINMKEVKCMKFGDKLIQLRKKHGLSQEDLAAKLNVSRQSVSKWESNNTYPETDKIVQICNIFECSMDDLINENIKDINQLERKSKKEISIKIDPLLDFIAKTVNMFYNMKFLSGLKCLIELALVLGAMLIIGDIINHIIITAFASIFSFIPWNISRIIRQIISGVIDLAWYAITIIAVIHIFKIRYLDYYEQIVANGDKEDKENKEEKATKISLIPNKHISLRNNEPKIVIRDKEPLAFLNLLAKIAIWFIKSIAIMFGLFLAFILLLGVIGLAISISLSLYTKIFIGLDIGILGLLICTILLLAIIIHFVIGTKINIKLTAILFISSIIVTGIGTGISITAIKDINYIADTSDILEITPHEKKITYKDNLIIMDVVPRTYEYIINDSLDENEIIVQNNFDARFSKISNHETTINGMPVYRFYLSDISNIKTKYSIIINDLKNNIIRDYDTNLYNDDIKIIATRQTIEKLINNFSKIYVYDQAETETGYKLSNISDRIIQTYSECGGEYNAITGEIETSNSCKCIKEENSDTGIIEYSCHYIED